MGYSHCNRRLLSPENTQAKRMSGILDTGIISLAHAYTVRFVTNTLTYILFSISLKVGQKGTHKAL